MVPLAKLKKSPKNVRKMPHTTAEIEALAASIASLGMLQFPIVEPELGPKDKPTGGYLVNAGEGQRPAPSATVKRFQVHSLETGRRTTFTSARPERADKMGLVVLKC